MDVESYRIRYYGIAPGPYHIKDLSSSITMPPPGVPKLSTITSWILYFIPIYILIIAPLLSQILPPTISNDDAVPGREESNRQSQSRSQSELYYDDDDVEGNIVARSALKLDDDSIISLEDDGVAFECPRDGYGSDDYNYRGVHLLSKDPLVIYIEGFLRHWEADYLVNASINQYTPSVIYDGYTQKVDPTVRLSDRALLNRDNVVRCIEERARSFQGWRPHLYIERLWTQRYNVSGHYEYHYDWSNSASLGGDRISTFMVYLDDKCTGGGTNFPRLKMPTQGRNGREKWCRFLECEEDEEGGTTTTTTTATNNGNDDHSNHHQHNNNQRGRGRAEGITFKPIKGNAIYWENLRADGTGYPETWHAAFPVTSGSKVGMNIWSWYQPPRWSRRRS